MSALISFVGSVTKPGGLKDQAATLNASAAPGRPWLDLAWQLFGIATALVPVALVAHLLLRERRRAAHARLRPHPALAGPRPGRGDRRGDRQHGIAFYLAARGLGFNLTVVPEALPDVWWKYPVLVLSALQNAILEEVIVVGYLLRRLGQLGLDTGDRAGRPAPCCAAPTTSTRASAASSATW